MLWKYVEARLHFLVYFATMTINKWKQLVEFLYSSQINVYGRNCLLLYGSIFYNFFSSVKKLFSTIKITKKMFCSRFCYKIEFRALYQFHFDVYEIVLDFTPKTTWRTFTQNFITLEDVASERQIKNIINKIFCY